MFIDVVVVVVDSNNVNNLSIIFFSWVKNSLYCWFPSVMVLWHHSKLLSGSDVSVFLWFTFLFDSMLNSCELSFIFQVLMGLRHQESGSY